MSIKQIAESDADDWLQLALELWPDHTPDEMRAITRVIAESPKETAYIVRDGQETAIGFINLSLRYDYVPGAVQKPVAYVEGIYVRPAYQQRGVGRRLIQQAERWAREQGCHELGSDVLIDNKASARFHSRVGFEEMERTVFFLKTVA